MKLVTQNIFFLSALILFSCGPNQKKNTNTLSNRETEKGWDLLFDGKTLDNWKTFNGGEVIGWKIIDGELYNSGVGSDYGGDIITKNQYENFELFLEWKIDSQSNSGIFYLVQEGLTDAIYETGPEYQLIDCKGWPDELDPTQCSGANYAMHAPVNAKVKPIGEWNTSRIVVKNPQVEHWLNGVKVVEYELWSEDWQKRKANSKWADKEHYARSKSGHIGLQDHGGLTVFRNIKIRGID